MPEPTIAETATYLLDELEGQGLEVVKVPSENGYVRVPVSVNAEWYRHFCASYKRSRNKYPRPRTIIKRCHTISALKRIISGNINGVYAERLMPYIEEAFSKI